MAVDFFPCAATHHPWGLGSNVCIGVQLVARTKAPDCNMFACPFRPGGSRHGGPQQQGTCHEGDAEIRSEAFCSPVVLLGPPR